MKIAVTGGAGFIGSHVVDQLLDAGHRVVVIDTRSPHRADAAFRDVDITDLAGLVRATAGCDVVFHLAAVSNVNDAQADPVGCIDVNVTGTARVWEAARRNQVGRAVLASTVWVYAAAPDDDQAGDLTEDTPLAVSGTEHVYTASKISAELVVTSFHELFGQPYTILRYGIPFGPRMRDALVIPRFMTSAQSGTPITIHGDGMQFRNYVYVEDMARAHLLALGDAGINQIFNLEGPAPVSIRHVAETVRDLLNPAMTIEFVPARPGDYAGRKVSAEKAGALLGWRPTTSFDEGMRRYAAWWTADGPDEDMPRVAGKG